MKKEVVKTTSFRLSKKSLQDFFDSLQNAVTSPPLGGGEVLAPLAARLALQGVAGHSISLEVGCRPIELPRPN